MTVEPFQYKEGTVKRGNAWTQISDILNSIQQPIFRVNQRSVREHFGKLKINFLTKMRDEEKGSGIDPPELTDVEKGLEEIIEKWKEADTQVQNQSEDKRKQTEVERHKAEEMRSQSLETFQQTRKRLGNESTEAPKCKKRSSGTETIAFLKLKAEKDAELKQQELDLRKLEQETQRDLANRQQTLFVDMLGQQRQQMQQILQQQQDAQQHQNQIMVAQAQQQQQQAQLFAALIEKIHKE